LAGERDVDDNLFICIALESLLSVKTTRRGRLFCIQSLIPWFDDVSRHSIDSFVQGPDSIKVDFGVERVAGDRVGRRRMGIAMAVRMGFITAVRMRHCWAKVESTMEILLGITIKYSTRIGPNLIWAKPHGAGKVFFTVFGQHKYDHLQH
jgi:hypothetical protein